jgi:MoaA/NifB/PqqE/SkfB family radical SAM enzyme
MKMERTKILSIPGLKIYGNVEDRRVRFEIEGALTPLARKLLTRLFSSLQNEKIIKAEDGKIVFTTYLPPIPSEVFKRVIKNQLRPLLGKLRAPDAATIAVTQKCPCRCVHCSAHNREFAEMDRSVLKKVIKDLLRMGTTNITFTGGEPFAREDIYDLVKFVNPKKAISLIFTSGFFLNEENLERVKKAGLYALHVSIDSPHEEVHDSLRGVPGLFRNATRALRIAVRIGLMAGISTYATHEKIKRGDMEKMIELGKSLGVHEITIFDQVNTGRLLHCFGGLSESDHEYLIELHLRNIKESSLPRVTAMSFVNSPYSGGCFAGYNQLHITPSGEVTPCDFHPISFGNVHEESVEDIWRRIREHEEYKKKLPKCRMQNPEFRRKYISKIPEGAKLPVRIDELEK